MIRLRPSLFFVPPQQLELYVWPEGESMFDPDKSLDENLIAFRAACDAIDPDCAKILFDNLSTLRTAGAERNARQAFNGRIKLAVEALPDPEPVK